jgi:hypothetical protein
MALVPVPDAIASLKQQFEDLTPKCQAESCSAKASRIVRYECLGCTTKLNALACAPHAVFIKKALNCPAWFGFGRLTHDGCGGGVRFVEAVPL